MRMSVDSDDPGYRRRVMGSLVYFNGELVKHCITADEEIGYVEFFETDACGRFVIDDGIIRRRRMSGGDVRIVMPNGA